MRALIIPVPLFIPGNVIESISLKSMRIISTSSENPDLSIVNKIKSWKLTVWKNGFRVSGSETDLPDFLYKVPPVYLSAKFIGMKVVPEVFRQMRYKPEPVDHFHV